MFECGALVTTMLTQSPPNAQQRVDNGFDTRLFCLISKFTGFECCKNQFNFADLCAETDLFAKLPVVFTSAAHIPSDVSLLIIPSRGMSTEYWTGPNVESPTGNFLNAQETVVGGAKYFYTWSGGGWSLATDVMFRSAVQTVVYYQDYYVKVRINGSTPTNLGSLDASVTSLRVSGSAWRSCWMRASATTLSRCCFFFSVYC